MSTYYADINKELVTTGIKPDELAIYTGVVRSGLRGGPSTGGSKNAYVYWWQGETFQELDARFRDNVLEASIHGDRYIFVKNGSTNFLQQVSGPAKPVVIGNIGAEAIRVNTPLGKFLVPAGSVLRLDRDAPLQREKKKVLLTFTREDGYENALKSALILEGERWKPLNICAAAVSGKVNVKDGLFTLQTLVLDGHRHFGADATLKDPPFESDYEIYLRSASDRFHVYFGGVGMRDEGLTRAHHSFALERDVIYDYQKLRQTPSTVLMSQCAVQLPGLEEPDGGAGAETAQRADGPLDWLWGMDALEVREFLQEDEPDTE